MSISLDQFASEILSSGNALVDPPIPFEPLELEAVKTVLIDFEQEFRTCLPEGVPELEISAATWGIEALCRICQLFVYRDQDVQAALEPLTKRTSDFLDPRCQYSVFLSFRLLPSMASRISTIGTESPLHKYLESWSSDWPLSCFLEIRPNPKSCEIIAKTPALLDIFCEQILRQRSLVRVTHPAVKQRILQNLSPQDRWRSQLMESESHHGKS